MNQAPRPTAASCLAALLVFAAVAADSAQQAPPPGPPVAAPQPGQAGRGRAGGRGPAVVDTLDAGPWDLGTGRGRTHVSVLTKGLDNGFIYALTDETFGAALKIEPAAP
ncbi:MAG: hypothetical protein ABI868_15145 [Acidobacteriota bacterium]